MPFVYDFSLAVGETSSVEVYPQGWRCPVTVEYAVAQAHKYDTSLSIVWRVRGTTHCFTIAEQRLNVISHGDYKSHFKKALEGFREDYITWFKDEYYANAEWKYEYQRQFGNLIITDSENNGSKNKIDKS